MMQLQQLMFSSLLLVLSATASQTPIEFGASVAVLNEGNFDTVVADGACGLGKNSCPKGRLFVVDFYAPWCPHCQKFAPTWSKLAAKYKDLPTLQFGAVDCDDGSNALCDKFKVKGFPAIRAFVAKPGGSKVAAAAAIHFPGHVDEESVEQFFRLTLRDKLHVVDTTDYQNHKLHVASKKPQVSGLITTPQTAIGFAALADAKAALAKTTIPVAAVLPGGILSGAHHATAVVYQKTKAASPTTPPPTPFSTARLNDKPQVVLNADLAAAVFFWFKHNVLLRSELTGERLAHTLAWVHLLSTQLGKGVEKELQHLEVQLAGKEHWTRAQFEALWHPMKLWGHDRLVQFDQCASYACGLWTIFHVVQQNAIRSPAAPQQTLVAIRKFVATFFACTDCQEHFAVMSSKVQLEVPLNGHVMDGAVWLWRAHNHVSRRLAVEAGRTASDFPSPTQCSACKEESEWDLHQVFVFLQAMYGQPAAHPHSVLVNMFGKFGKSTALSAQIKRTLVGKGSAARAEEAEERMAAKVSSLKKGAALAQQRSCSVHEKACSEVCGTVRNDGQRCVSRTSEFVSGQSERAGHEIAAGKSELWNKCACAGPDPADEMKLEKSMSNFAAATHRRRKGGVPGDTHQDTPGLKGIPEQPTPSPASHSKRSHAAPKQYRSELKRVQSQPKATKVHSPSSSAKTTAQKAANKIDVSSVTEATSHPNTGKEDSKSRKRNLILALIILGLTGAVLLGVLVHNRVSAGQSNDGGSWSNCWNRGAHVAPGQSRYSKVNQNDDGYDVFGEPTGPQAHPAQ